MHDDAGIFQIVAVNTLQLMKQHIGITAELSFTVRIVYCQSMNLKLGGKNVLLIRREAIEIVTVGIKSLEIEGQ